MARSIPALSIRQPWAWAILHAGKDVENRNWSTRYRGPVYLHAAKGMTQDEYRHASSFITGLLKAPPDDEWLMRWLGVCAAPCTLDRGGVVGIAEIADCVSESPSPWFFGRYGFVLRNVRPLPFVPCKGALGFFPLPEEARRAVVLLDLEAP